MEGTPMKIFYQVLSVSEQDHSAVVRYFTADQKGSAEFNLSFLAGDMTDAEIHDQIVKSAPTAWLAMKQEAQNGPTVSVVNLKKLLNKLPVEVTW